MEEGGNSLAAGPDGRKRRVVYYYDPEVGNYYYGQGHPMKPHRMRMTHCLLASYNVLSNMEVCTPYKAQEEDICKFHAEDYIDFLKTVTPEKAIVKEFGIGDDCPVFDGIMEFCKTSAGGSLGAAVKLNRGDADIAINWSGGLHHAKKREASGFCYVNDIVLAILELLKSQQRVLYIDIDVHHGDGVEEAFYTSNRVMTVSFHKYGDYFPGTGSIDDYGADKGRYHALNVPLDDGVDDESYQQLFKKVMAKVMAMFNPNTVVLQCGADSLSGDRLGCFNLSVKGHAECVKYMRSFNVPLLLVGGGGYTIRNVARCWCYETAVAVGMEDELEDELPVNDYYEYFGPDYRLHFPTTNKENMNSARYLENLTTRLLRQIDFMEHGPNVQFSEVPEPLTVVEMDVDEDDDERDDDDEDDELSGPMNTPNGRQRPQLWTKQPSETDPASRQLSSKMMS